jgi:diguanylate cyclase (GGDEF)-like protein
LNTLSIKWKAAIAATLFAAAMVAAVGAAQLYFVRQDLTQLLSDSQFGLVTRVAGELDSKLALHLETLTASAAGLPASALKSSEAFRDYYRSRPAMLTLFDDLLLIAPSGRVFADLPEVPGRVGINASDRDYFQKVLIARTPLIADPVLGKKSREPIVQFAAPVLAQDGRVLAVLTGVLRLNKTNFLAGLGSAKVGKNGYFFVFTKGPDSLMVMHPDAVRIMQPRAAGGNAAGDMAANGFEGTAMTVNRYGVPVLVSYKALKKVDWVVGAVLPSEEAFAPIAGAEWRNRMVTAFAMLVFAPLAWLVTWYMLNPLSALRDAIRDLRTGSRVFTPVPVNRGDEIGDLATDFNLLMSEREEADAKLSRLARFDTLTLLPNRLSFNEKLPEAIARSERSGALLALMFLDVDRFKAINDTHGHETGDGVLRLFASRVQSAVRETDTVARLAGDEFVIILEGLHNTTEAETVAGKILTSLHEPFRVGSLTLPVSSSIGIAIRATGQLDPDELLHQADSALYVAKRAGRNRFHLGKAESSTASSGTQ